ncbi:MAG: chorismate pyruvate-lyase family protein [Pseudomonadota bacterium]
MAVTSQRADTPMAALPHCRIPDDIRPILGDHIRFDDEVGDIERIMLACDGTFTFQLEAFVHELISVEILSYEQIAIDGKAAEFLKATPGDDAWERKVLLRGRDSDEAYVFAHSYVLADRLPKRLQEDLRASPAGIGRLFVDYRLSIYRHLVGYFFEDGAPYAQLFPSRRNLAFLARVYRVDFEGRPVMLITEKMPRDLFTR